MIGDELAVEQRVAAAFQPRDEERHRHLGRVRDPAEHALAEEGAPQRDAVQPADQLASDRAPAPHLDRMGMTAAVQRAVRLLDLAVDPGFGPTAGGLCARLDDPGEGAIRGDLEAVGPQPFGERARQVELVERQDAALLGFDPEDVGRIAAVGHREDADRIGTQQQIGVNRLGRSPAPAPQHQLGRRLAGGLGPYRFIGCHIMPVPRCPASEYGAMSGCFPTTLRSLIVAR